MDKSINTSLNNGVYLQDKKNKITFKKSDFIFFIFFIFISILPQKDFLYHFYFIINIFSIFRIGKKFEHFQPGLIMLIFFSTYIIYLIPLFYFDMPIASHTEFADKTLYLKTLQLLTLFFVSFNLFLKKTVNSIFKIKNSVHKIISNPLFYLFYFIQLIIIVLGFKNGTSIIGESNSYEAYTNNLENQNGLWEYFYIIYFLSFVFSREKNHKYLLYFTFLLYCYVSLTRGYRIQMIEMILLFFICFLDGIFNNKYLIFFSFLSLIFMEIFGILKNIGSFNIIRITESFNNLNSLFVTNQTEVFYSTTAVIALKQSHILGLTVQIETFFGFLINFLIPSGFMWNGSRLLDHVSKYSQIGGGGFCFGYAYFWFGYFGIILLTFYLSKIFNLLTSKSNFILFFIILTTSISPRWFAYEPTNHLIRMELLLVIIYFLIIRLIKFEKN